MHFIGIPANHIQVNKFLKIHAEDCYGYRPACNHRCDSLKEFSHINFL